MGAGQQKYFHRSPLPPAAAYRTEELLDYVETCVEEISRDFQAAHIVLAGDLNQLADDDLTARTGLVQIVHQPTRGTNILDRIYTVFRKKHPLTFSSISPCVISIFKQKLQ